jgi:hypothetical protein
MDARGGDGCRAEMAKAEPPLAARSIASAWRERGKNFLGSFSVPDKPISGIIPYYRSPQNIDLDRFRAWQHIPVRILSEIASFRKIPYYRPLAKRRIFRLTVIPAT